LLSPPITELHTEKAGGGSLVDLAGPLLVHDLAFSNTRFPASNVEGDA